MGRLFWKLFAALFLALLSTVLIVGSIVQWETRQSLLQPHAAYAVATDEAGVSSPDTELSADVVNYAHLLMHFPLSALIACMVCSALFAGLLAWSISHPIKLLLEHLHRTADGDLQARVSNKISARHDEFAELGSAFDFMTARLQTMIKSQSNMLHHVSHELRSPLARIQMAVGLVMQNPRKMQGSLQRVELEAVRMERMIAELLEIFRLESGMQKLQKARVDLKDLLAGILGDIVFERQDVRILLDMPDSETIIFGQVELLQRAIENVIRNAVKYGPALGEVTVEMQRSERTGEVVIEVQDQGQGVDQQELEHIFKPFVRGKRASQVDGHGIGLAMTKHIIEAHGGYVKATNLVPSGFMIRIHLPLGLPVRG